MSDIAVSNSTPLIHLSKIDHLGLLNKAYKNVFVPRSVESEIVGERDFRYGDVKRIVDMIENKKITVVDLTKTQQIKAQNIRKAVPLGRGESDSIVIAIGKKCDLLIDDVVAVNVARSLNINTPWTTSLVLKLYGEKKIDKKTASEIVKKLVKSGYWLSEDVLIRIIDILADM